MAGAWLMAALAASAAKENPYQIIVERNPFGLRPIVIAPAAPPEEKPATPPPELKITGVTTLLGAPKALVQYDDPSTKKTEFPPPLGEGESYKTFTVVSIDTQNSIVHVLREGQEVALDFVHNGVKEPTGPPLAASQRPPAVATAHLPGNDLGGRTVVTGPDTTTVASGTGNPGAQQPLSREEAKAAIEKMWEQMRARQASGGAPGQTASFPPMRGTSFPSLPVAH